ncbi:MAG: hypothetical protein ACR2HQ_10975 [Ilumatobacteraceae bacterium]
MDSDGRQDRASGELPPWAAAFDPAANLQVLSELQRTGLEAARQLVDRFAGSISDDGGPAPQYPGAGTGTGDSGPGDGGPAASGLDGLIDLWAELAKSSLRALLTQLGAAGMGASAGGDGASGATRRVVVERGRRPDAPAASTEIWLHNESHVERRDLRPHCGELRSADGALLAAGVAFAPLRIERFAGRSSQAVTLRVRDVADDAVVGTYRGVVLVEGLPDVWLTLEVVVTA